MPQLHRWYNHLCSWYLSTYWWWSYSTLSAARPFFLSYLGAVRPVLIYLTNLQIDNLTLVLQLLAATMSQLKMEPCTRRSTPTNTPTHKTVAGSSLFLTDMEFISTSPYFRRSLWLITSLSGESGDTHPPPRRHTSFFFSFCLYPGNDTASLTVPFKSTYSLSSLCTLIKRQLSCTLYVLLSPVNFLWQTLIE